MTFTVGGENAAQTLIVLICSDDIEEIGVTRLPSWLQAYSLLPHMGERGALTWLHGRIGERDALLIGLERPRAWIRNESARQRGMQDVRFISTRKS